VVEFHPISTAISDGPVLHGWSTNQGHREVIFFTHGNGFSTRVYEPMLKLLAAHYDLLLYDLPGHGKSPTFEFVGHIKTAEFLHQSVRQSQEFIAGRHVHVVAHSLGGMLTMLAASQYPDTFTSMVLLDPIMFPRHLLMMLIVTKKLGLTSLIHPYVKPTLRRRNGWSDQQDAFNYFHKRKIFRNWTDEALRSYINHALTNVDASDADSDLVLCCDPQLEAEWFGTVPSRLWSSVEKLRIPVSIFMGQDTYPFSLRAGEYAKSINTGIEYSIVPGDHCFMQEDAKLAADYVTSTLLRRAGA